MRCSVGGNEGGNMNSSELLLLLIALLLVGILTFLLIEFV